MFGTREGWPAPFTLYLKSCPKGETRWGRSSHCHAVCALCLAPLFCLFTIHFKYEMEYFGVGGEATNLQGACALQLGALPLRGSLRPFWLLHNTIVCKHKGRSPAHKRADFSSCPLRGQQSGPAAPVSMRG